MEFVLTDAEKETVTDLQKKGFSEPMATVAVAAKRAGYDSAIEHVADVVKVLTTKNPNEVDIQAARKRITAELAKLDGDRSLQSVQKRIQLKNALAKLK
jgi:hypothetical protein